MASGLKTEVFQRRKITGFIRKLKGIAYLFFYALLCCGISCSKNTDTKVIDITALEENKLYFYNWFNSSYIVFKPSREYRLYSDHAIDKKNDVIDPPETIGRTRYPVKIYMLEKVAGHLVFPYRKWHQYDLPCSNLLFFVSPFKHGNKVTPAGFRCNLSVDEFWNDHLVFDVNGRSQSSQTPDLYVPLHYQTEDLLIIGVGSP